MNEECDDLARQLACQFERVPRISGRYFRELADAVSNGGSCGRVADIGCGAAWLGSWLLDNARCVSYVGIDASDAVLQVARARDPRLCLVHGSALSVPLETDTVTTVVLEHVIHWIRDLALLAAECWRIVTQQGRLVVITTDLATIEGLWEFQLFPEALSIERRRLHQIDEIDGKFTEVGFVRTGAYKIPIEKRTFDEAFLQQVQARPMSSLLMLSANTMNQLDQRSRVLREELWGSVQEVAALALVYHKT